MKAAYIKGIGITLSLSRAQLKHNVKGGFLPFLGMIGSLIASKVVPAIATGLLTGTAAAAGSTIVNKIAGKGIIHKKKSGKVEKGVFLNPWSSSFTLNSFYLNKI